jgi:thiamine-phosphate pyrophosphorylase
MSLHLRKPILYLITPGASTESTTAGSPLFLQILKQVSAAVAAGIQLIQIREKRLTGSVLFELASFAVGIARGTASRILINDRADIAAGTGAAGVHLTTQSLEPGTIRRVFGEEFLIGASTHSLAEARAAVKGGADFIVFGPVFQTRSKQGYGPSKGSEELLDVSREVEPVPVIALGGISLDRVERCFRDGASGVAGITLFSDPSTLALDAETIRQSAKLVERGSM